MRPFISSLGSGTSEEVDLGHVLGGHALDGVGDELARPLLAFLAGRGLDLAVDAGHVGAGFLLDGGQQFLLGLVLCHLPDLLRGA